MWGADRFVVGAAATAQNLGVSPLIVGLTIVGFGTSAPEMLVSAVAAWTGNGEIAIGNAIGSNITNVALVLGVTALIRPLDVHTKIIRREIPLLLLVMGLAVLLLMDGSHDRVDGIALLAGMGVMIGWIVHRGFQDMKAGNDPLDPEVAEELPSEMSTPVAVTWFSIGLVVLLGSSRLLVWGAATVARHLEVSELVIGLTIVAFGTSLPELAASVAAALKKEHDIAVGNVIGSNMFNLLGVLGLPGAIAPGTFDPRGLTRDFPIMMGLTLLLLVVCIRPHGRHKLSRPAGMLLLACFVGYLVLLSLQSK